MMSPDMERYAEALAIERLHGEKAEAWIVRRIDELASSGDIAGMRRFTEIARRLDRLRSQRHDLQ